MSPDFVIADMNGTFQRLSNIRGARICSSRMSFIIDKQRIVAYIDTEVRVKTHSADMVARLKELGMAPGGGA